MGLTRAFIDIPLDTRRDIVLALARDLEAILRDHVGTSPPITIRDLRPTDINGGTVVGAITTPALTADVYSPNVYSSLVLNDHMIVGIYGIAVKAGTPLLDELTWIVNDKTTGVNVLTQAWVNTEDPRAIIYPAVVWPYSSNVQVNMLSHKGGVSGANVIEWLGVVAETQSQYSATPPALVPGKSGNAAIPGWLG